MSHQFPQVSDSTAPGLLSPIHIRELDLRKGIVVSPLDDLPAACADATATQKRARGGRGRLRDVYQDALSSS